MVVTKRPLPYPTAAMNDHAKPPAPALDDRLAGAVWGLFAGDAYGLAGPAIDDADPRAAHDPDGPGRLATRAPATDHHGDTAGDLTPAGDGALVLLEALAAHGADPAAYGRALVARHRGREPGHVDAPTRHLLAARARLGDAAPFDHGADDDGNVTPARLAPLVALRLGHPALMLDVDAFTRVLQDNDRAVAYACAHARLLEHLFAGRDLADAIARVDAAVERRTNLGAELGNHFDAARRDHGRDVAAATAAHGRGSGLVEAFPAALQAALAHEPDPPAAIRATGRAGGDGAGRAMLVGSWLGARHGRAAIPTAWRARLRERAAIARALERLLARRRPAAAATRH